MDTVNYRLFYTPYEEFLDRIRTRAKICPDAFFLSTSQITAPFTQDEGTQLSNTILVNVTYKEGIVRKTLRSMLTQKSGDKYYPSIAYHETPLIQDLQLTGHTFRYGSYLVDDPIISEVMIACLMSSLLTDEISYNFIQVHGIESDMTKLSEGVVSCSIYMERLYKLKRKMMTDGLVIQVLHAIHTYQKHFKLQHNDLTTSNIFMRKLDENSIFKGAHLMEADYFQYNIDLHYIDEDLEENTIISLYVPNEGYVACIGDFGTSSTWGEYEISEATCFETGYDRTDKKSGRCLPKGYSSMYDVLLFLKCIILNKVKGSNLAESLLESLEVNSKEFYRENCRPRVSSLHKLDSIDVIQLLYTDRCMTSFLKRPLDVKIAILS
jgi:hypothetical protein